METTSLFYVWKKYMFCNIILTQNHAWHIPKVIEITINILYKQQLRNNNILSRALFRNAQ
jgi:hypothetical protein